MPLSAPEYWLEWTKNYFRCQFTHVGELIHKETWSAASFGWAEGLQRINPPIYRLTTAVSDIDQTNINRDIRDGNWLSSWTRSPRNPVSEPGGANEANARVSRCAMIRQTRAGGKQALNATSVNSHLFIDSPHPARQCNIFANGVNFSIFTHFLCVFITKTVEIRQK